MLENFSLVGAAVPFEVQLGKGLFRCPYWSTPIKSLTTFLFLRNYEFNVKVADSLMIFR